MIQKRNSVKYFRKNLAYIKYWLPAKIHLEIATPIKYIVIITVVNIDADFPANILAISPYYTDVVIIYSFYWSSFNIIFVASNPPSEMRDYLLTKEF